MINRKSTSKKLSYSILLFITLILIPQMSCSLFESREDYKKEIELKGIEYSRDSFLKEIKNNNREIVELFIKAGIDVNAKDSTGTTALMMLSNGGNLELAKLLINNGADVNARDENGISILRSAIHLKNIDVAKLLIQNGANVNDELKGSMPILLWAVSAGDLDLLKLLIEKGADVNSIEARNEVTALRMASSMGNLALVKLLIEKGANVNYKARNGGTAYKDAMRKGYIDVAEFLRTAGARE